MATWKKVIVSGSNVSQLNNDANYLTTATLGIPNGFSTASINGINLLADSPSGSLNFASSSGAGLNITGNSGTDTLTFTLGSIPNGSLTNSTITVTAGSGLTGGGSTALGGTSTLNVGAGTYITVNADDVAVNTTTLTPVIWAASGSYTGSIFTGITGDVTISTAGVSAIGAGVIVNNDVNASAGIVYTKLSFAGSGFVSASSLSSPGQGEVALTTNGVAGSTVDLGLQTTDSPQFVGITLTGDAAVNGGDITTTNTTATVFNTTATTVNAFGAATTLNLGAGTSVTTIGDDLIVNGDLTVKGDTTVINTSQLLIEDPFILLASGSTSATDAGILIDRGSDTSGNIAFGFDAAKDRFGFANGLTDITSGIDTVAAGGVSGSFVPYLFTETDHGATKPVTGEFAQQGAMYMTTAGDFWIYA